MNVDEILTWMKMVKGDIPVYIQEHNSKDKYQVSSVEVGEDGFVIHYKYR